MGVPSLGDLCRRVARAHIDQVQYMPELLPWPKAKELLVLVKKPEQLAYIEEASPHIFDDSDGLWEAFVKRKFDKRFKRLMEELKKEQATEEPTFPGSWRDLFTEWWEEDKIKEAQDIARMEMTAEKRQQDEQAKSAWIIPPQALRSIRSGTWKAGSTFSRGFAPRPKNAVQQAKMHAKEETRRRSLAKTWVRTSEPRGPARIRIVPRGLAEEVRIRRQPKFVPRPARPQPSPADEERARREARLLAVKNGTASSGDKPGGPPARAADGPKSTAVPSTAPKKPKAAAMQTTTDLLFPGANAAKKQQKVIIKTVPASGSGSALSRLSSAPTASLSTSASPPGQAYLRTSPERDHSKRQGGSPAKPPAAPSAVTPAKRQVFPSDTAAEGSSSASSPPGGGPGSPPGALPPRKRKKVDVFMPKKRT